MKNDNSTDKKDGINSKRGEGLPFKEETQTRPIPQPFTSKILASRHPNNESNKIEDINNQKGEGLPYNEIPLITDKDLELEQSTQKTQVNKFINNFFQQCSQSPKQRGTLYSQADNWLVPIIKNAQGVEVEGIGRQSAPVPMIPNNDKEPSANQSVSQLQRTTTLTLFPNKKPVIATSTASEKNDHFLDASSSSICSP